MKVLHAALLVLLVNVVDIKSESLVSYEGCKVYEVKLRTRENANFLESLVGREGFDFWSMTKLLDSTATVMVAPDHTLWFESALAQRNADFDITIDDLEAAFERERQSQLIRPRSGAMTFNRYYQHQEINDYLDNLQKLLCKNVHVKVNTAGKSFEGREIKTITLTNGDGKKKNSIFIDAGIHAREWIAPATALYFINQFMDPHGNNVEAQKLLEKVDIVVMPVVNADGYQYSHQKERLWRKTRSRSLGNCVGTDGNRNFDFHWGEVGASSSSCSETYRGKNAFSEIETQVLRDVVMTISDTCKFYLTLHSYGNYLLYPWGYTSDLPDTWRDLEEISQVGAQAIHKATGAKYTVGSSTNVLYAAAGGSDDYMFAVGKVPISITMELPGGGRNGFDPPASDIQRMANESVIGIFAMIQAVADKYSVEL